MSDRRPILLFVGAKNCSHCHEFYSLHWNNLRNSLQNTNLVDLKEVHVNSINDPLDARYGYLVKGFPAFLLLNKAAWNSGSARGEVYNSRVEGKATAQSIERWALQNLNRVS